MEHVTTLQQNFISMLPGFVIAMAASFLWWLICRYIIYRKQHVQWLTEVRTPSNESDTIDAQLVSCSQRLLIAQRGSPADRLFLLGLALMGTVTFLWVVLMMATR